MKLTQEQIDLINQIEIRNIVRKHRREQNIIYKVVKTKRTRKEPFVEDIDTLITLIRKLI